MGELTDSVIFVLRPKDDYAQNRRVVNSADMEPIRHTLTARLKYLKMYREDVDQLVAIFVSGCEKVIISDSKYRYDSLDEMKEKAGPRLKDLDIRGEIPVCVSCSTRRR